MDQLFQLWKLLNAPSTSEAWKLNKVDFVKTVFRTMYMTIAPVTVTQMSTGDGSLNYTVLGGTALAALVVGITLAAKKANNPPAK